MMKPLRVVRKLSTFSHATGPREIKAARCLVFLLNFAVDCGAQEISFRAYKDSRIRRAHIAHWVPSQKNLLTV